MSTGWKKFAAAGLLAVFGAIGCSPDKPHEYGQARQPVDELNGNDSGLQSKDVVDAADKIARDLLADPNLNASQTAWTIVVSNMEDQTTDRYARVNFNIFLQALKGDLARMSGNRIQLVENKDTFHSLRSKELESERDDFGQGAGRNAPVPQAINPDYAMTGTAMDLPNRSTNFYLIDFRLDNLRNRTIAFDRQYQVKVER
jgi:hypothetical protein